MNLQKLKKAVKIAYYAVVTSVCVYKSGLFDSSFYQKQLKSAKGAMTPVVALFHYLFIGYRQRLAPSPYICPEYYYSQISFPETERVEPIYHYVTRGWKEGVNPNPFFETERVKEDYLGFAEKESNPVLFYLKHHKELKISPSRYIDIPYYTEKYEAARTSSQGPWSHYLYHGEQNNFSPSIFLENWLELACFFRKDIKFFDHGKGLLYSALVTGVVENFSQVPVVDPLFILEQGDNEKCTDTLLEWANDENIEKRWPSSWFDPDYYSSANNLNQSAHEAIKHYSRIGVLQGAYPNDLVEKLQTKPLISILVPVYNVKASFLNRCIRSVLYQSYPHWQLCLADDASTEPHVAKLLSDWAALDERIEVSYLKQNQGIAGATNAAGELAKGQYFAFLDNDDELEPEALFSVVKEINQSGADFIYTDESLVDHNGRRVHVFHKPGFNRELLYNHNYITHFVVTHSDLFYQVGGLDSQKDGAQDFDYLLKVSEKAKNIKHIARSLYKWRATESSTTINHESKSYADDAGKQAVIDALGRQNIAGQVYNAEWKFYYTVQRAFLDNCPISIYCDCREVNDIAIVSRRLREMCRNSPIELYLVVSEPPTDFAVQCNGVVIQDDAKMLKRYNTLIKEDQNEYILFLDGNLLPENELFISELLAYSQREEYGVVAGRVLPSVDEQYRITLKPDVSRGDSGYYAEYFCMATVHMSGLQWSQEVLAADFRYCMVKRSILVAFDGFNENYSSLVYGGMDFSLRAYHAGYTNIYASKAVVKECDEKGPRDYRSALARDLAFFKENVNQELYRENPYFNPNVLEDFSVNLDDFYSWYC